MLALEPRQHIQLVRHSARVCQILASLSAVVVFAALLVACGVTRTTSNSPAPPPVPPSQAQPSDSHPIAFLRIVSPTGSLAATQEERQEARRRARTAHTENPREPITSTHQVDMHLLPFTMLTGWWFGAERRITSAPGPYTSVHVSTEGTKLVFSSVVNGYNQLFVSPVPKEGDTLAPTQLTNDLEHHWAPHLNYDGSKLAFTKFDAASNGDVLCIARTSGTFAETCLDFSSTTPVLRGANLWHASWYPDDSVIFEAWGGPLNADELFSVNADGSNLKQITRNAGTPYHYESPSVSWEGFFAAAKCTAQESCDVVTIDLNTGRSYIMDSGWDPLCSYYTVLWIQDRPAGVLRIDMAWSYETLTKSGYGDFFDIGYR